MRRIFCGILAAALVMCCSGCSQPARETVFAMDTVMDLQLWGAGSEAAMAEVKRQIAAFERDEPEDAALTDRVLELSERTGGAFDPQLFSVMALWNFTGETPNVPTEEQIREALQQKQWDLGGALKGYAGQQVADYLSATDVTHGILNLGGNIQTYGSKPDGTPWSVAIQNPAGGDPLGVLSVVGTISVVTSGDYQRYFERDGVRYHHILDPQTGKPARSGLSSVTVICRDGLTADCLSTALFVMGLEQGSDFWRQSDDFEAVFVTAEGRIYATAGAALSGCEYEVIDREN